MVPPFLNWAIDGCECSASRPGQLTLGERAPVINCIGGWVGLRAGMDAVE
jgi:hypothetical protein